MESPASAQMLELLNEVAEQSDKITLKTDGNAQNVPGFTVSKNGEDSCITFAGLLMGHKMTSFILAILQASGYPPKIEWGDIDRIQKSWMVSSIFRHLFLCLATTPRHSYDQSQKLRHSG